MYTKMGLANRYRLKRPATGTFTLMQRIIFINEKNRNQ